MATQVIATTQVSEQKLIRAGQRGDAQAVEALFRRYHRPLFQTALRVLGNAEDAEDAEGVAAVARWRIVGWRQDAGSVAVPGLDLVEEVAEVAVGEDLLPRRAGEDAGGERGHGADDLRFGADWRRRPARLEDALRGSVAS